MTGVAHAVTHPGMPAAVPGVPSRVPDISLACRVLTVLFLVLLMACEVSLADVSEPDSVSVAQGVEPAMADGSGQAHGGAHHSDPFAHILLQLALVILVAMLGRWGAGLLNQPSVLGELLVGVVLGNTLYWLHVPLASIVMHMDSASEMFELVWGTRLSVTEAAARVFPPEALGPDGVGTRVVEAITGPLGASRVEAAIALWIFSSLGVILLLFLVGLESSVDEMRRVGGRALMVAIVGILAPFALGYGASAMVLPESGVTVHLFIGATLTATSVGITARVFKDLDALHTPEARLILGAAVIDDILGLIVLAVVVGTVVAGGVQPLEILRIVVLSAVFFSALVYLGGRPMFQLTSLFARLDRRNLSLLFPLVLAFLVAWVANLIGLATIVGAFAAGLILNEDHFRAGREGEATPMTILAPLEALFAPVFFVLMGMQVNLSTFMSLDTLWLALLFVVAAVAGKLFSGLAAGGGMDRISVGIGMVPRGEVGLIFASVGKGLGVVTDAVFSAVVIMVIITTFFAPLGLKWSLVRGRD